MTVVVRTIIDGMRAGADATDPGRWFSLADSLDDAGYDREARIARTQAAILAAEFAMPDEFGRTGGEAALAWSSRSRANSFASTSLRSSSNESEAAGQEVPNPGAFARTSS
jgi:hypothetical protein